MAGIQTQLDDEDLSDWVKILVAQIYGAITQEQLIEIYQLLKILPIEPTEKEAQAIADVMRERSQQITDKSIHHMNAKHKRITDVTQELFNKWRPSS